MQTGIVHHSNEEQRRRVWDYVYALSFHHFARIADTDYATAASLAKEDADAARDSLPATIATMTVTIGGTPVSAAAPSE